MRIALSVLLVVVAGCQKSATETTVKTPEGSITVSEDKVVVVQTDKGKTTIETSQGQTRIESEEGTAVLTENKVPENFPIPVVSDAVIERSAHVTPPDGRDVYQLSIRSAAGAEQVAQFYEKAFKDAGFATSRADQTSGDMHMIMLTGTAEGLEATGMIVKQPGSDETHATISWATRERGS